MRSTFPNDVYDLNAAFALWKIRCHSMPHDRRFRPLPFNDGNFGSCNRNFAFAENSKSLMGGARFYRLFSFHLRWPSNIAYWRLRPYDDGADTQSSRQQQCRLQVRKIWRLQILNMEVLEISVFTTWLAFLLRIKKTLKKKKTLFLKKKKTLFLQTWKLYYFSSW